MATSSSSYDLIADLLSTNNTISIATLVGASVFGILTVYGCFLTWRHQQWERHLERRGSIDAEDGLEVSTRTDSHEMRDLDSHSNDQTAVEERSDGTHAASGRSSLLASSTLAAGDKIYGLSELGNPVDEGIEDGQGHVVDEEDDPQRATQPANLERRFESDGPTPFYTAFAHVVPFTDSDPEGSTTMNRESVAGTAE